MKRALASLVFTLALAGGQTGAPLIWFCPLDPLVRPEVGYGGSPQYMRLFSPTSGAGWDQAAARTGVFKIYPQWISSGSDDDLRTQFADLKRRGIVLALEYGLMSATASCGRGVEGFGGETILTAARRVARLGGDLRYVAMDEPIYFGSMYSGANACRWSVDQVAATVAANVKALWSEFPAVLVGDIEPLAGDSSTPDRIDQYGRGFDAIQAALGRPLAFVHLDVDWNQASWPASVAALRQQVASRQLAVGVIYNGGATDQSDASWLSAAEAHMVAVESAAPTPDHVIFQSWNAYPLQLLPDQDPASFTNLINKFFRIRTQLSAGFSDDGSFGGALVLAGGDPLGGAIVTASATPLSGQGSEAESVIDGIIPAAADQLILGIRINIECGCQGQADFLVRHFRFETEDGTLIERDFVSEGLAGWGRSSSDLATLDPASGQLHIVVGQDQSLLMNAAPARLASKGGQKYRLRVTATIPPASAGSGYFAPVFLAGGREVTRGILKVAAPDLALPQLITANDGTFAIDLTSLPLSDWLLHLRFAGNAAFWPAIADVPVTVQ